MQTLIANKADLIRKLKNSKFRKQEIINEFKLTKYEVKVSEFDNQKDFLQEIDRLKHTFNKLHQKGKLIIHDLAQIQHKIIHFCQEVHQEFEKLLSGTNIDEINSVSHDWGKFRTDEFISDNDLWELDENTKIIDIIQ